MNPADKAAIDEITKRFYNAFTNRGGIKPDTDALFDVFMQDAVIIKTCGPVPTVYDVNSFVEPRKALLTDGTLVDFSEEEVSENTTVFGHIAQRFSRYKKSWKSEGALSSGGGAKSLQFIRTEQGWRIASLTWDDE